MPGNAPEWFGLEEEASRWPAAVRLRNLYLVSAWVTSSIACADAGIVVPTAEGEELTIWDSKESEFSLGLEYRRVLRYASPFDLIQQYDNIVALSSSDPIRDLDWTATPDNQSILAVGFAQRIELLCQQRATYFDETPGWGACWKIDFGRCDLSSC